MRELKGLIAATFTPMKSDGTLEIDTIPPMVEYLLDEGITGMYVCGSTGEGPLLSGRERCQVAEAYVQAVGGRIPVILQIGHDSLAEAGELARQAQQIGADAISAIAPRYFGCDCVDTLIESLCEVTSVVPDLPFFYYHIPRLSGVDINMMEFMEKISGHMPNFAGIKFSSPLIHEFQECLRFSENRFTLLFGCDEMLLSALSVGAYGAVGSTYNFAAPLYLDIMDAYQRGDMKTAQRLQWHSVQMCRLLYRYRGQPAIKAMMRLIGYDCGPTRLPLRALSEEEIQRLHEEMKDLGFFDWGRIRNA